MTERTIYRCWEPGPQEADGMLTTCMLEGGHDGPHKWTRDGDIMFSLAQENRSDNDGR